MELNALLQKLKTCSYSADVYGKQNSSCELMTLRFLVEKPEHYLPTVLYLTDTSMLPAPDCCSDFVIFCYGAPIDFEQYSQSTFTVVYLGESVSTDHLTNTLLEYLTEIQQLNAGMHILVNALFSDQGLQSLIDTASQIFGNPLYFGDLQGKYLAISSGVSPDDEFFRLESKRGYISSEGMDFIRKSKIEEKVRELGQPYYFYHPMIRQGTLIDAVHIQDIPVGHLMLQEANQPISEYDSILLHRFSRLVAMELQKNSFFSNNKGVMYSYFLADLLRNSESNSAAIKERLTTLGYQLKEYIYLLVIPSSIYHTSDLKTEIIIQNLRMILPGSLYVIYEDSIVFLITKEKYQGLSEFETNRLSSFLGSSKLKAGISNYFGNLTEASRFYKQAISAVEIGMDMNPELPIYYYRDYYLYEILKVYKKTDSELRYLIHPGLMTLFQYDQEKGTDFLLTLRAYLKTPMHTAEVAKELHIHKNTLLYRLGKIKEITRCDFLVGEEYMMFNFSIKIMEYLHMIK